MATASSNIKRTKIQGNITLTLSPEEAVYLKELVGITCEINSKLEYVGVGDHKTAEVYSVDIWKALDNANVPDVQYLFKDDEVQVCGSSLKTIADALDGWKL